MGSSTSKSRLSSWSRRESSSSSSSRRYESGVYPASQLTSDNEAEVRLDCPADQSLAALKNAVDDAVRLSTTAMSSMPDKDLDDLLAAVGVVVTSLNGRWMPMPQELRLKAKEALRTATTALASEVLDKMVFWDMSPVADFVERIRRQEPAAQGPDHVFDESCISPATAAGGSDDMYGSTSPRRRSRTSSSSSTSSGGADVRQCGGADASDKSLCRKGVLVLGDTGDVPMVVVASSVRRLNRIVRCLVDAGLHRNLCSLTDEQRQRFARCFDSDEDSWLTQTSSASFSNSEDVSENSICRWILAFKLSVKVLRLMWQQFSKEGDSSEELAEVKKMYFTAVSEVPIRRFLATAKALTEAEWPAEKMSPMFLLMEAFDDILPQQLPKLLPSGSEEMKSILQRMKGVVGRIFEEMKIYITRNPVIHGPDEEDEVAVDDSIHPLTKFVLRCMVLLSIHRKTVDTIFVTLEDDKELESSFVNQLKGVIDVWEASLQEYYHREAAEHPALRFINLLNNVHWLSTEGITAEDRLFMSERLIEMHREENISRVDKLISGYLEECWTPHLSHLNSRAYQTGRARASKLKRFKEAIEATINIQAAWQVPDSKLRKKIRGEIIKHVVEKYRAFLGQSDGKADELESMINQLFQARMN